jgi:ubiquinone/menaquinone biosynthesis C-methylase UbiE
MSIIIADINEQSVAKAFTKQSVKFDDIYAGNTIVQYKRERVRNHVLQYLQKNSSILELNSGTGEDAIFFAEQKHHVHATDIAAGMQEVLIQKVTNKRLTHWISTECCSFTRLHQLKNKGPYDLIFSNFGGLNCTNELDKVIANFESLLKPGGVVSLVIISKFSLWESLLFFKGKWKTATRRFFNKDGRIAHIEGQYFNCWYYHPGFIVKRLKNNFEVLNIEGLCTIVPPSYLENFEQKHPSLYRFLKRQENNLKQKWPWKYIGDYFILSMKKK